jgi:LAS superfamily LD-carboxypeptidase LdcB
MREQAATPFENLAEAFYEQFDEKILVVSSYRSYDYQAGIKARGCPDNLCAKAGHSEHQS